MSTHRLTDDEVTAILVGLVPDARGDNAELASVVTRLRSALYDPRPPQPSAELAARLDQSRLREVSAPTRLVEPEIPGWTGAYSGSTGPGPRSRRGVRARRLVAWASGLGLGWKVALGSTAAFAAVTGTGAAHLLPDPAQVIFDRVIDSVTPDDGETEGTKDPLPTEVRRPSPGLSANLAAPRRDSPPETRAPEDNRPDRARTGKVDTVADGRGNGDHTGDDTTAPVQSTEGSTTSTAPTNGGPKPGPPQQNGGEPRGDARDAEQDAAEDARDDARDAAEDARDDARDAAEDAADDAEDAAEEEAEKNGGDDD